MIKHLLFDFGGVFFKLNGIMTSIPDALAASLGIPAETVGAFYNEHKNGLLLGRETTREFIERLCTELGIAADIDGTHANWQRIHQMKRDDIDWALVEYVASLKQHYRVHLLSNMIDLKETAAWVDSVHGLFDTITRSHMTGYQKPEKEAYLHTLAKIEAKPEECVFIDDLLENVEAAEHLGITGLLYTDVVQLKRDFERLGVV